MRRCPPGNRTARWLASSRSGCRPGAHHKRARFHRGRMGLEGRLRRSQRPPCPPAWLFLDPLHFSRPSNRTAGPGGEAVMPWLRTPGPLPRPRGSPRWPAGALRAWHVRISGSRRPVCPASACTRRIRHAAAIAHPGARRVPEPQDVQLEAHSHSVMKAMIEGRVIPFLGAGVNLCGRPAARLGRTAATSRAGASWRPTSPRIRLFSSLTSTDLLRVSQYVPW